MPGMAMRTAITANMATAVPSATRMPTTRIRPMP